MNIKYKETFFYSYDSYNILERSLFDMKHFIPLTSDPVGASQLVVLRGLTHPSIMCSTSNHYACVHFHNIPLNVHHIIIFHAYICMF